MTALRWIGMGIIGLALLVAVAWGIGTMLPEEHRASVSATLPVDIDVAWTRIDTIADWPQWRDAVVEELAPESVVVTEGGETLRYGLERPRPYTLVTTIATPGLPFGGRWIWTVEPAGAGRCTVTIVEEGEVYDPIFRVISRFVIGHDATLRSVLDRLTASFDEQRDVR